MSDSHSKIVMNTVSGNRQWTVNHTGNKFSYSPSKNYMVTLINKLIGCLELLLSKLSNFTYGLQGGNFVY